MRPFIVPFDGMGSYKNFKKCFLDFVGDSDMAESTGFVKFNDAVYFPDMSAVAMQVQVRAFLKEYAPKCGVFLDLKLADTNGTIINTLKHFVDAGVAPDILTVRESISIKGYFFLRRLLPNTKLAIVSALTDIPEDEIRRRYGMFPALKIINDITNIQAEYSAAYGDEDPGQLFDMIVCSPHELKDLTKWFPVQYQYIVPGIRDAWMREGQQARIMGIRDALDAGATYVVMGSQLMKGNPKEGTDVHESRRLTLTQMKNARYSFFSVQDPIQMLYHCNGYYESPRDEKGDYLGPLVGYAGKDDSGKNYVGFTYFNFAKAEENSLILAAYAYLLAQEIKAKVGSVDVVLGMPMGGLLTAGEVARFLGCRTAFAEKKVIRPADEEKGIKEDAELVIKRHDINPGDRIALVDDVCNNFSTPQTAAMLVAEKGAEVVVIATDINRSEKTIFNRLPVVSVCHIPSGQHSQDEPEVLEMIKAGNIVWKPKHDWDTLKNHM